MIVLQWCKTQVMCLLILAYVGIIFIRDGNQLKKVSPQAKCNTVFDLFFAVSELAILFDGITACTINFPDQVPNIVNLWMHLGMFLSYEIYAMLLFLYWVSATVGIPKVKWKILPFRDCSSIITRWSWDLPHWWTIKMTVREDISGVLRHTLF